MRRYDQAIANSEKALALAPNNAEVHAMFGAVLNYWGNPERGLEELEKAFSLRYVCWADLGISNSPFPPLIAAI